MYFCFHAMNFIPFCMYKFVDEEIRLRNGVWVSGLIPAWPASVTTWVATVPAATAWVTALPSTAWVTTGVTCFNLKKHVNYCQCHEKSNIIRWLIRFEGRILFNSLLQLRINCRNTENQNSRKCKTNPCALISLVFCHEEIFSNDECYIIFYIIHHFSDSWTKFCFLWNFCEKKNSPPWPPPYEPPSITLITLTEAGAA